MLATKSVTAVVTAVLCAASAATTYVLTSTGDDPQLAPIGRTVVPPAPAVAPVLVGDGMRRAMEKLTPPAEPVAATSDPHGVFPHYAGFEVLPNVRIQDLLTAQLSDEDAREALSEVNFCCAKLSREAFHDPDAYHDVLTEEEAGQLSAQGIAVMTTKDRKDGERKWFTCPDAYQARVHELQLAAQLIQGGDAFVAASKSRLMANTGIHVDVSGAIASVRDDGTGINLVGPDGQVLSWTHYSIPGKIPLPGPQ